MLHAFSFSSFSFRIFSIASFSASSILANNSSAIRCFFSLSCLSASSAMACIRYFSNFIRLFYSKANFKAFSFSRYFASSFCLAASFSYCILSCSSSCSFFAVASFIAFKSSVNELWLFVTPYCFRNIKSVNDD